MGTRSRVVDCAPNGRICPAAARQPLRLLHLAGYRMAAAPAGTAGTAGTDYARHAWVGGVPKRAAKPAAAALARHDANRSQAETEYWQEA
jgi:hypothetical protein